jgi:hypothetical protein
VIAIHMTDPSLDGAAPPKPNELNMELSAGTKFFKEECH